MTGRLDRMLGWLVEPAPGTSVARGAPAPAVRATAPCLAVLADAAVVRGVAAVVALRAAGAGVGVVGVWPGRRREASEAERAEPVGVAVPAARRLAVSLRGRGLRCRAAGRLVRVELAIGEDEAVAEALRIDAAAAGVASVLAVAGPRGERWDSVLAARDLVLVHAEDGLAALAVSRLGEQGIRAAALEAVPAALVRAAALAGVAVPGALPPLPQAAP